jgi:hypothetical protein
MLSFCTSFSFQISETKTNHNRIPATIVIIDTPRYPFTTPCMHNCWYVMLTFFFCEFQATPNSADSFSEIPGSNTTNSRHPTPDKRTQITKQMLRTLIQTFLTYSSQHTARFQYSSTANPNFSSRSRKTTFPEICTPRFGEFYIPAPRAVIRLSLLVGAAGIEPAPDTL